MDRHKEIHLVALGPKLVIHSPQGPHGNLEEGRPGRLNGHVPGLPHTLRYHSFHSTAYTMDVPNTPHEVPHEPVLPCSILLFPHVGPDGDEHLVPCLLNEGDGLLLGPVDADEDQLRLQ